MAAREAVFRGSRRSPGVRHVGRGRAWPARSTTEARRTRRCRPRRRGRRTTHRASGFSRRSRCGLAIVMRRSWRRAYRGSCSRPRCRHAVPLPPSPPSAPVSRPARRRRARAISHRSRGPLPVVHASRALRALVPGRRARAPRADGRTTPRRRGGTPARGLGRHRPPGRHRAATRPADRGRGGARGGARRPGARRRRVVRPRRDRDRGAPRRRRPADRVGCPAIAVPGATPAGAARSRWARRREGAACAGQRRPRVARAALARAPALPRARGPGPMDEGGDKRAVKRCRSASTAWPTGLAFARGSTERPGAPRGAEVPHRTTRPAGRASSGAGRPRPSHRPA